MERDSVDFTKIMSDWNPDHADSLDDVWELSAYMKSCFGDYFHAQTRRVKRGGPREIRYKTPDKSWQSRWLPYRNAEWSIDPAILDGILEGPDLERHIAALIERQKEDS